MTDIHFNHQLHKPSEPKSQETQINRKTVFIAFGGMAIVVAAVVGGISFRNQQYNKIAQAQTLLHDTCHTATLANVEALTSAENGWNSATAILQKVPKLPGLGGKDAERLQSDFKWCQININATRTFLESATTTQTARDAVKQSQVLSEDNWAAHLRQLDAAIEHLAQIPENYRLYASEIPQELPIFRAAENRLKDYRQIRAVAQSKLKQEHQAVQNWNTAEDLHRKFEISRQSTNSGARAIAEENLQVAIDRLREIPLEGTTISVQAVNAQQRYRSELYDFKAEPARWRLHQLADRLNQLASALESGMPLSDYSVALENLTHQFAQLQQEPMTSNHPALPYFERALRDYRLAQALQNVCNESDDCLRGTVLDNDLYLRDSSEFYRPLVESYRVEPVNLLLLGWAVRLKSVREPSALTAVLEHAQKSTEKAVQLIDQ